MVAAGVTILWRVQFGEFGKALAEMPNAAAKRDRLLPI
jgi:hypothetical protein